MMTDDRDLILHTLFAEVQHELDGDEFTARVMAQTRSLSYRVTVAWICAGLVLATCTWMLAIPLEVAQLITQALTTTLIDLGDSWVAWAFSPVNNIAALLVLLVKAIRIVRKKITNASYSN